MVNYKVTESVGANRDYGEYMSYGIAVYRDNNAVKNIDDVFLEKITAEHFVSLLNSQQLDIVHLDQIIEDYLRYGYI